MTEDTYYNGLKAGVRRFAWWKDGVQYVGTTGTTLEKALIDIALEEKKYYEAQLKFLEGAVDEAARIPVWPDPHPSAYEACLEEELT